MVLHVRLPDGLPQVAIDSAVFRPPVPLGGQVLELMNLSDEALFGMSTLRMYMGENYLCIEGRAIHSVQRSS